MRRQLWPILLLLAAPCSAIFRWSSGHKPDATSEDQHLESRHHGLDDDKLSLDPSFLSSTVWDDTVYEDQSSIMRHAEDTLKAYEEKTDCFKTATRALRQGCKNIEMDEGEKAKYAIRLTACEIATANIPMPVECRGISEPEDGQGHYLTENDIARCVQSLGQVPQFWTSYSGYFRKVKVMCLAVGYSLEQDDYRRLQRNLTRSYADQLALLGEQRRALLETRRLETASLKEIQNLHASIKREMKESVGALRQSMGSMAKEIAEQQAAALVGLQISNDQLMKESRANMEGIVGSVSQGIYRWNDQILTGLARSQELNSWSQETKVNMGALISVVIDGLGELTKAASEGYKTLVNQQNVAAKEMEVSAQASLASTQSALHTLHSDSHAAWHNMMDEIKHESSTFHDEISRVSKATMSDIGTMAMASQGQLEDFNRVMNEFKTNQGDILWQLRALHRALRVFTGATKERISILELVASISIIGAMAVRSGVGAAALQLSMAMSLTIGREWLELPVRLSFLHALLCILVARLGTRTARSWRRPSLHVHASQPCPRGTKASDQHEVTQRYGKYGEYYQDMYGGTVGQLDLPPRYSQDDEGGVIPRRMFAHQSSTSLLRDQTETKYDIPSQAIHAQDALGRSKDPYYVYYAGGSFGLSLGSCA